MDTTTPSPSRAPQDAVPILRGVLKTALPPEHAIAVEVEVEHVRFE
jgi:hypothetical protein